MSSRMKLMNRKNTLSRRLKLYKELNRNARAGMKNALESTGNIADHIAERISELEDRN